MSPSYLLANKPLDGLEDLGVSYGSGNSKLFVFVSATCPYCKVFHESLKDELVKSGFNVIYLFIAPNEDVNDLAYKRATNIYCSSEKIKTLDGFSNGVLHAGINADPHCPSIVDGVNELSSYFGIRGTPTIVFPDSSTLVGVPKIETVVAQYIRSFTHTKKSP